jgi:hypothetical protein
LISIFIIRNAYILNLGVHLEVGCHGCKALDFKLHVKLPLLALAFQWGWPIMEFGKVMA